MDPKLESIASGTSVKSSRAYVPRKIKCGLNQIMCIKVYKETAEMLSNGVPSYCRNKTD